MTSTGPLSTTAETVLLVITDPTILPDDVERRLDAALWADEAIELLRLGYAKLHGTLIKARLVPTIAGVQAATRIRVANGGGR